MILIGRIPNMTREKAKPHRYLYRLLVGLRSWPYRGYFLVLYCGIFSFSCHREVRVQQNIVYRQVGDTQLELDLYFPPSKPKKPRPAVIALHGGAWRHGDKGDMMEVAIKLAKRGYVVASVGYRFAPDWPFPAQLEDVQAAVRWLRQHAEEYQIEPEKIGGLGASAGAHLVALLGLVDDESKSVSSKVACVVSLAGPVDLRLPTCRTELANSPELETVEQWLLDFIGHPYNSETNQLWQAASPLFHVTIKAAPFFMIHGTIDQVVSIKQSEALLKALKANRVEVKLRPITDLGHSLDVKPKVLYRFWQAVRASFRFLDQHLKSKI